MKKLFQTLGTLTANTKSHLPNRSFISVGEDVFAVAHSPQELSRAMKMQRAGITGYVFLHHHHI